MHRLTMALRRRRALALAPGKLCRRSPTAPDAARQAAFGGKVTERHVRQDVDAAIAASHRGATSVCL